MKILIVSQRFFPETFQINEICFDLAKRGHDVFVLTGIPNYPQGKIFSGYKFRPLQEKIRGVHVIRVLEIPRGKSSLGLFFNYLSFSIFASQRARKLRTHFDAVFCYQLSPVFQLRPAVISSNKNHAKLLTYCLDLWPESLKAKGIKEKSIVFRIVKKMAQKLYARANHIWVSSPSFSSYLVRILNIDQKRISFHIQNGDTDLFKQDFKKEGNEYFDFLYTGNIGNAQNVEDIIIAYSFIRDPKIRVHILGQGSHFSKCVELTKKLGVSNNVFLYGHQTHENVLRFYKNCDACILTLNNTSFIGNTIPSKLIGYMGAGKPILAAIDGDARVLIEKNRCGKCVDPGDPRLLANAMLDFTYGKYDNLEMGKNGKIFFENQCMLSLFVDNLERFFENRALKD